MRSMDQPKQVRPDPFAVVLQGAGARELVVLHTVADANQATLAFHAELQRLTEQRIGGDLRVVQHAEELPRTLLRQPLG